MTTGVSSSVRMARVPSDRVWTLFSVKSAPRLPSGVRETSQLASDGDGDERGNAEGGAGDRMGGLASWLMRLKIWNVGLESDQARLAERMALVPSRQTKMIEPNQMKSFRRNSPLVERAEMIPDAEAR